MKKIILTLLFMIQVIYAQQNTILFLGDSLTEGLGVSKEDAYPSLVEQMIKKELQKDINVINGGVSGSTTNDGLARLQWYLKKNPSLIFIALGANDGLRGLDLKKTQQNLEEIIQQAKQSGAKVLLAGMLIPPNYGADYSKEFEQMYIKLQKKYQIKNMSFLLEGVAGEKALNQKDGIHPNEKGHRVMAQNIFNFIKEYL